MKNGAADLNRDSPYFDTETLQDGLKGKAIKGGSAMLVSRSTNLVLQLVSTVILARLLTPEDFGLVTMVTAISLLFFNVGLNGFSEAIIQIEKISHRQISTVFWIGLALSSSLAVTFSVCSPLLARFYREPRLVPIAIAFSVGFIFSALATEHIALIMRSMQFHKLLINEITAGVVSTGLAIWMAFNGFGYWAIVARHLSNPIVAAVCAWLQCPWRPGRPSRSEDIRPIIKFAVNTFGIFLVNYFGRNLDKILLGRRWGGKELGSYDRAYYLFVMPANQLVVPLSGVALATLSRLNKDPERYRAYFLKALSLLSFIGMLVSAVMTVTGRDIILLLLGPQWQKTGVVFSALGPAIGITVIYGTIGWLHLSQGKPGRWLRWGIIAFIITTLSLVAGLPFGALGVALAYSLSFYLLTWPGIWYAAKPMGIPMRSVSKAVWRFFAAAVISGITTWGVMHRIPSILALMGSFPVLVRIMVGSAFCACVYMASIAIMYGGIRPLLEMARLIRLLIPGGKNGKRTGSESGTFVP